MKTSIAIFINSWLGTSETFIANQLEAAQDYFSPVIIARSSNNSELKKKFADIPVYYLKDQTLIDKLKFKIQKKLNVGKNNYALGAKNQNKVEQICEEHNIKLIHAHYGINGLRVLPVVQELDIPLLTTFHGYDLSKLLKEEAYKGSLNFLLNYSKGYQISISNFFKKRLLKLGSDRRRTFKHYIGIDTNKFTFNLKSLKQYSKITFLQISNFVPKKGHKYTVKAFSEFCKTNKNVELVLGGDGPTLKKTKDLVERLDISDRVKFLGRVNPLEVPNYMKNADVFVHNSITGKEGSQEGIPTVIMEAMASGLPVLSTKHSGVPELVTDGEHGYLSAEKDIEEYLEAMGKIIHADIEKMSKKAHQQITQNFNLHKQNKILGNIYSDIISTANN